MININLIKVWPLPDDVVVKIGTGVVIGDGVVDVIMGVVIGDGVGQKGHCSLIVIILTSIIVTLNHPHQKT